MWAGKSKATDIKASKTWQSDTFISFETLYESFDNLIDPCRCCLLSRRRHLTIHSRQSWYTIEVDVPLRRGRHAFPTA